MTDNTFLVPQTKSEPLLTTKLPCPFSAKGMLQPSHLQPPPMFGPRGATIPAKHMAPYAHFTINRSQSRAPINHENYNKPNRSHNSSTRFNNKFHNNNHTKPTQRYQRSREFCCEPCDRDFSSQDLFLEHKSQHQKCGIDGCKFEGHEIIVTKHIQMQHSTGLYERLKNLETPEDILKWREERKKRYPTKSNIELRQKMQEERNKRGEKLNNSKARFGRSADRKRCSNKSVDQNHIGDRKKEGKKKRRRPNKKVVVELERREDDNDNKDSDCNNGLPKFKGTSTMKDYKKRKEVQPKNALSGLGMYGSDSDSDSSEQQCSEDTPSSEEEESKNETSVLTSGEVSDTHFVQELLKTDANASSNNQANDKDLNSVFNDSFEDQLLQIDPEDLPSEEPILKQDDVCEPPTSTEVSSVVRKRGSKVMDKRISKRPTIMDLSKKYRNQNTMLEKLLQNEIRHERNVLLQCVRHIVKENFFGIGPKPS